MGSVCLTFMNLKPTLVNNPITAMVQAKSPATTVWQTGRVPTLKDT
jgi:hypothetical protein